MSKKTINQIIPNLPLFGSVHIELVPKILNLWAWFSSVWRCMWYNFFCVEVYVIQLQVIKFISDMRQVSGFLWYSPTIEQTATILPKYCW